MGALEPGRRFTAVDPSGPMLDIAAAELGCGGMLGRTEMPLGYVDDLPAGWRYEAATLAGVLHHRPDPGPSATSRAQSWPAWNRASPWS